MFCHIVGVEQPDAIDRAIDLGKAMQLTNISRDVRTDLNLGRLYLPQDLCEEQGLKVTSDELDWGKAYTVTKVVLDRASELYRSGDQGLVFLPLQTSFAVSVARHVYAAIGAKVLRAGPAAWDKRQVVPGWQKAILVVKSFFKIVYHAVVRSSQPLSLPSSRIKT
jgi:phytoene synthase